MTEEAIAFASATGALLAGALGVTPAKFGPTGEMGFCGEARQVSPNLGTQVLGCPATEARDAIPDGDRFLPGQVAGSVRCRLIGRRRRSWAWVTGARGHRWWRRLLVDQGGNLLVKAGDLLIQEVNMGQMAGKQEAMLVADPSRQRLFQFGALGAHPAARQGGQLTRLRWPAENRRQHRPCRAPHQIGRHGGKLEVGLLPLRVPKSARPG